LSMGVAGFMPGQFADFVSYRYNFEPPFAAFRCNTGLRCRIL
jgi:hypothetical protein